MKSVMGLINLYEDEAAIYEMADHRPLAAMPFAGRYRLIDFVLSSMVNSGIQNVGILLKGNFRSLMDHLRSGKEWDLARKRDGLCLLPPAHKKDGSAVAGDVEAFHQHLDYLECSHQQYILISGSHFVCNANYRKALQFHENTGADITMVYADQTSSDYDFNGCTMLETMSDGRIVDLAVAPSDHTAAKMSLGTYLLKKQLFIDLIRGCYARGGSDFVKDVLIKNLSNLKVYGYLYTGFVARVHSVESYYKHNLELLIPEKWQDLFAKAGPVYTKVKDGAPAKYKEQAQVKNTMVANGCIIEGLVEGSMLFRDVKVQQGANVVSSIVMQKCRIEEGASLEYVICDKDVVITRGKHLRGDPHYPLVIAKGTVI